MDIAQRAVLKLSDHVAASTNDLGLARCEIVLQVLVVIRGILVGHEHLHVLANDLSESVAPELLSGLIEDLDDALVGNGLSKERE